MNEFLIPCIWIVWWLHMYSIMITRVYNALKTCCALFTDVNTISESCYFQYELYHGPVAEVLLFYCLQWYLHSFRLAPSIASLGRIWNCALLFENIPLFVLSCYCVLVSYTPDTAQVQLLCFVPDSWMYSI